jgi:hypothetical protein
MKNKNARVNMQPLHSMFEVEGSLFDVRFSAVQRGRHSRESGNPGVGRWLASDT